MKSFAWLRARPKALISTGIVIAAALTVGFFAVVYEGKPTSEVDLHGFGDRQACERDRSVGAGHAGEQHP